MLKENKKLGTKVESLTRKVQNLQAKLAAAKASIPKAIEVHDTEPSPGPATTASTSRPRANPSLGDPSIPPIPPLPSHAPSPQNRTPVYRAVSGPSSLPRPKTPERRATQPAPVFKARTPERGTPAAIPESMSSTSTIGKKRRAPDDFESYDSAPPQGFTVDSVPSHDTLESTTPRVRRVLSNLQSGFTPKRYQNTRPTAMPSPKRQMTATSARPPVIADVTNSPRGSLHTGGQSAKEKRSWLGKIRGQTTTSRPTDSRARFEHESS